MEISMYFTAFNLEPTVETIQKMIFVMITVHVFDKQQSQKKLNWH